MTINTDTNSILFILVLEKNLKHICTKFPEGTLLTEYFTIINFNSRGVSYSTDYELIEKESSANVCGWVSASKCKEHIKEIQLL